MSAPLGIGFLGAGPATQAIHLPTLARMSSRLRVAHVMDTQAPVARAVAARCGAAHSTDAAALLADPAVDIVAITSPSPFHAEQALAAIAAGKRGLLIEKPFAVNHEEARQIADAARKAGTAIVVGAMHVFDPGWQAALAEHGPAMRAASFIRSTVILPPNPLFEDWATQIGQRGGPPPPRDFSQPEVRAAAIAGGTLGLAIHDLPLIRSVLPDWASLEVLSARPLPPFGYVMNLCAGQRHIQLVASLHRHRKVEWRLDFHAGGETIHVDFAPSYVHAGSASVARHTAIGSHLRNGVPDNGYAAEWDHLHRVMTRQAQPIQSLDDIVDDFTFAMRIAEGASREAGKEWL